ncbi:hypothetical protein BD414DRAFT_536656 [Trametes punicea]|nr:hypothetical protein BD414DRAFT_536656 [Trametes punicea]
MSTSLIQSQDLVPHKATPQDYTEHLPFEILSYIFIIVRDKSEGEDWLSVTWVNRYWRDVALGSTGLWLTMSFDHRHTRWDVSNLLQRSGMKRGLELSFNANHLDEHNASLFLIKLAARCPYGTHMDRLRSLAITAAGPASGALDYFLPCLRTATLQSLTLEDWCTNYTSARSLIRRLPSRLPALRELRLRGLVVAVPKTILARLETLEISDTAKYEDFALRFFPCLEGYLRETLAHCTGLKKLILKFPLVSTSFDHAEPVKLPALEFVEILDQPYITSDIFSKLDIPGTAAVHLHSRIPLHGLLPTEVLLYDVPRSAHTEDLLPVVLDTTALSFEADTNTTVRGWTDPSARGAPNWSVMAELSHLGEEFRQGILPFALRNVRFIADPAQIVHLELHFQPRMYPNRWDCERLLPSFTALRVLRVGGELAVRKVLQAQPTYGSYAIRKLPVLPPTLQEFGLCVDRLTSDMRALLLRKLRGSRLFVRVLLPGSTLQNKQPAEDFAMTESKRLVMRLEYSPRCSVCYTEPRKTHCPGLAEKMRLEQESSDDASDSETEEIKLQQSAADNVGTGSTPPALHGTVDDAPDGEDRWSEDHSTDEYSASNDDDLLYTDDSMNSSDDDGASDRASGDGSHAEAAGHSDGELNEGHAHGDYPDGEETGSTDESDEVSKSEDGESDGGYYQTDSTSESSSSSKDWGSEW